MEETEIQPEQTTVTIDEPEQTKTTVNEPEQTRVLMGVSQSTKGYPYPSQSSLRALEWVLQKLIHKQSGSQFKLQIVHVTVPDVDGLDEVDSIYATHADLKRKETKKSLQLLEVFVKKCKEAFNHLLLLSSLLKEKKIAVEAWVKVEDPREVICAEVLRVKLDLLILGSRGLGTLPPGFRWRS